LGTGVGVTDLHMILNHSCAVEIVDAQHLASIIDDAVTYGYHICDILRRSKYGLPGGVTHQRKNLSKALAFSPPYLVVLF